MGKFKRFCSLLIGMCLVIGMLPGTAFAVSGNLPFTDVNTSDWFYDAVQYAYEKGMMNGTSSTTFAPDNTTTRGMIVTILHRMEGTPDAAGAAFIDVPADQWYTNAVAWANANGIVNGYGDGKFGPDDAITREQMVTILYRYSQYKGYDTSVSGSVSGFSDAVQISAYAIDAMNWTVGNGLVSGFGNGTLAPKGGATRAQVATILMRFCNEVVSADEAAVYSIAGITVENKTVSVIVSADNDCTLQVMVLDNDGNLQLDSARATAYGGSELETVAVQLAKPLPEYFQIIAVLVDGNGNALCNQYTCIAYSAAYKEFEAQTIYDFEDQIVLNFDDQIDDNFGVLAEDVIQVDSADDVNYVLATDNTYTFYNIDEQIKALNVGDEIVVFADGNAEYVIQVASIYFTGGNGDIAVIEASEDTALTDFYAVLKIDMEIDAVDETEEIEAAILTAETARSVSKTLDAAYYAENSGVMTLMGKTDTELSDSININKNFAPKAQEGDIVKPELSLKGTATLTLKIAYDPELLGAEYFENAVSIELDGKLTASLTFLVENQDVTEKTEINLGGLSFPTPIPALTIKVELGTPLQWKLQSSVSAVLDFSIEYGYTYNTNDGIQMVEKKEKSLSVTSEVAGSISVGLRPSVSLAFLSEVGKISLSTEFGVEAEFTLSGGVEVTDAESIHACAVCLDGDSYFYAKIDVAINVKLTDWFKVTLLDVELLDKKFHMFEFYISIVNDEDSPFGGSMHFGTGNCTNRKYKTTFLMENTAIESIGTAVASITKNNVQQGTAHSGDSIYLYNGDYTVSTDAFGEAVTYSFTVASAAQTITLSPSGSGSVTTPDSITISGRVIDADTQSPITDAAVTIALRNSDNIAVASTTANRQTGEFQLQVDGSYAVGTYTLLVSSGLYTRRTEEIKLSGRDFLFTYPLALSPYSLEVGRISGTVTDADTGSALSGVTVNVYSGETLKVSTVTDADGKYSIETASGIYSIEFVLYGYTTKTLESVTLGPIANTYHVQMTAGSGGGSGEIVASGTCGDNLTWTLDGYGTLTISGTGDMENYFISVLSPENGAITPWNEKRSDVITVVIENGVTSIGDNAFQGCVNLTSVTIPNSVTTVRYSAFENCTSLTRVNIPSSVTDFRGFAFSGTPWLTSLGEFATVNGILLAYQGSDGDVIIPSGVISIGSYAFYKCSGLTSVTIPSSVTSIGSYAFCKCSGLTSVTIPYSVTSIKNFAFDECTNLTSITIPSGVTSIEQYTFAGCRSLTSVSIPSSVTSIGQGAFSGCSSILTDVYYAGNKTQWGAISIHDGNFYLTNATIHYNSTGT